MSDYGGNFDKIFGKPKPVKGGSFVQLDGELVSRQELVESSVNAPMVMHPMKAFVSPIDRTLITSRAQLAAHNKKHGVTNSQDYSNGYIEKRARARVKAGADYLKTTRRSDINRAFDK